MPFFGSALEKLVEKKGVILFRYYFYYINKYRIHKKLKKQKIYLNEMTKYIWN